MRWTWWGEPREYEFQALATYNSECSRGIVHTPEYDAAMAKEQERFDERMASRNLDSMSW